MLQSRSRTSGGCNPGFILVRLRQVGGVELANLHEVLQPLHPMVDADPTTLVSLATSPLGSPGHVGRCGRAEKLELHRVRLQNREAFQIVVRDGSNFLLHGRMMPQRTFQSRAKLPRAARSGTPLRTGS